MAFDEELCPGVAPSTANRPQFVLNHTMLRIRDPKVSLAFYTGVLRLKLLRKLDFPEMKFSLYFLAFVTDEDEIPEDAKERTIWTFSRAGVLELTHNWGSENDPEATYHNGNSEPKGFGHICVSVPDLDEAVELFDAHDVKFIKRPDQGSIKDVVFIADPDNYWIEVIEPGRLGRLGLEP
jgi:lactoylglutathione lyase